MKKYIFLLFVTFTGLQACSDFEDVNTNPNATTTVDPDLLLNNILYAATGDATSIGSGTYDMFVGGDMGACWAQHWTKVLYNNEERYITRTGTIRSFWQTIYTRVLKNANTMQVLAESKGNKNLQGISLVLKAYGFSLLTDCYGDIPFSEALKPDQSILKPKYDKQEDVYTGILSMLDEAGVLIGPGNGEIPASSDFMYGGDVTKWKKFAASLKFRCLMRIVAKKPSVSTQLQVLASSNSLFTSNEDEAKYFYNASTNNPIYNTIVGSTRIEYKVCKPLIEQLKSFNDPRLAIYAQPNVDSAYNGKPAGYTDPGAAGYTLNNVSSIGTFYLAKDLPAYLMSYAQLQFLLAEARQRGYITTSTTKDYYEAGVRASFLFNGLSNQDADTYLASVGQFNSSNALNQIATQEWIALYGQGIEAWTEWRRTKIPVLTPAIDGVVTEIPSRFTYPDNEVTLNKDNYQNAVSVQGPDLLTTKIWWITN